MSDDSVRAWLVDRSVSEKPSLINHVYATRDGGRYLLQERSVAGSGGNRPTTAGIEVDPGKLSSVEDEELLAEYAAEAERMADKHALDDPI